MNTYNKFYFLAFYLFTVRFYEFLVDLYTTMNEARYNLRNRGECRISIQLQLASDVDFLTASGGGADSVQTGQVVTDLSDSGSDIDISALVDHSDQNLSSSPIFSGRGVHKATEGQASHPSGSNAALTDQQYINSQILSQLSALGARLDSMENSMKKPVKKTNDGSKIKKSKNKVKVDDVQAGAHRVGAISSVHVPHNIPPPSQLREEARIQEEVQTRLRHCGHDPGSSHVHKTRTILNSQYSHKDVWSLSSWSKSQIKQRFESAMAVLKLRDHRTYAQALLSKQQTTHKRATGRITEHHTTHKGDPNALNQLMVNTDFNTSEVKESSVYVNKQDHQKVSWVCTVNNARDISGMMASNPQATHRQVKQCEPVAISNRFQVLDSIQEVQPITSGEDSSHNGHSSTSDSYLHEDFTAHQKVLQPDLDTNIVDYTSVPEYKKCKEQIGTKFGCVPLAPIYVYKGPTVNWDYIPDVLTAHKLIRQSNLPNFLGLRIPVRTNLNVDSWRRHLADYFDQQLPDLI